MPRSVRITAPHALMRIRVPVASECFLNSFVRLPESRINGPLPVRQANGFSTATAADSAQAAFSSAPWIVAPSSLAHVPEMRPWTPAAAVFCALLVRSCATFSMRGAWMSAGVTATRSIRTRARASRPVMRRGTGSAAHAWSPRARSMLPRTASRPTGACVQPFVGTQASTVQPSPSSQSASFRQQP